MKNRLFRYFGDEDPGRSTLGGFLILFGIATIGGRLLVLVSIAVSYFAQFALEEFTKLDIVELHGFILGAILGTTFGFAYGLTQAVALQNYRYYWVDLWFTGSILAGFVIGGLLGIVNSEDLIGKSWDSWVSARANLWAVISWGIGSFLVYHEAKSFDGREHDSPENQSSDADS